MSLHLQQPTARSIRATDSVAVAVDAALTTFRRIADSSGGSGILSFDWRDQHYAHV